MAQWKKMGQSRTSTGHYEELEHYGQLYQPYISGLTQNSQNFTVLRFYSSNVRRYVCYV